MLFTLSFIRAFYVDDLHMPSLTQHTRSNNENSITIRNNFLTHTETAQVCVLPLTLLNVSILHPPPPPPPNLPVLTLRMVVLPLPAALRAVMEMLYRTPGCSLRSSACVPFTTTLMLFSLRLLGRTHTTPHKGNASQNEKAHNRNGSAQTTGRW